MKKCEYSSVYEESGNNQLVTCELIKGGCVYQGKEFNSSSATKKYIVCNEKGLATMTTKEEHLGKEKREEYLRIDEMIDDLVKPEFKQP